MARFVIFGVHGSDDVMVNVDHVIAVDQVEDSTREEGRNTCRLWLTAPLWTDGDGNSGQTYIDVAGCLLDTQEMLNTR